MQLLQDVQFYDKYSRFDYSTQHREDWEDTVKRVTDYLFSFDKSNVIDSKTREKIYNAIHAKEVMPSMRNIAMAGKAAARQNACSYNCAYTVIADLFAFQEAVIILMSGSGLGYSVEKQYVDQLPPVIRQTGDYIRHTFEDTTEGWAEGVYVAILAWMTGLDVKLDYSKIRPAGSPLLTKGGRASGSKVLKNSLEKIKEIILARQDYKLRTIDVHDMMCHLAACIVSGGVRRSAMIALFDYDDHLMLTCKNQKNIIGNEQRYLSNNSAVWTGRKSYKEIEFFMTKMFDSGMGEPGIFSRHAANKNLINRRQQANFGTNPCGEIFLRPYEFCNLSSVVCRPGDTEDTLKDKVEIATIIGTLQSMSEHFPGLRSAWKKNQQEERLLGVDLNGIMDTPIVRNPYLLDRLKEFAIRVNAYYADKLNINQSVAITCVKPSGNSSVLLNTSPGIHTRWSDYYIRRIQLDSNNPILTVLQEAGVPIEPSNFLPNTFVASFPVKSPDEAITNGAFSALEQLQNWKLFKEHWTEHNPSVTISYREDEREEIIDWVYDNQEFIGGLSFLPKDDTHYEQMPYEAITKEQYEMMIKDFPVDIDWQRLHDIEQGKGDQTNAAQLAACSGDKCLITF